MSEVDAEIVRNMRGDVVDIDMSEYVRVPAKMEAAFIRGAIMPYQRTDFFIRTTAGEIRLYKRRL